LRKGKALRRCNYRSRVCWPKKPFIVPIPGTGKVKHLQENIAAASLELTLENLKEIDNALAEFKVRGGRMNEQPMKVVEQ
jgi:diketogulonate reductase-like aldo/keto reductase